MSKSPPLLPYQKPWLSLQDQIALLQSRGMVIADAQAAIEFLQHINYYRFSFFCVAFKATRNKKRRELFDAQDRIDEQRDGLIGKIEKQLKRRQHVELLFLVRRTVV